MKRRDFLKNLGLGLGVSVIAPYTLLSNETLSESKCLGVDGGSFNIVFEDKFEKGDILTDDYSYGQMLIVINRKGLIHEVKLVTNDKAEWWLKKKRGTTMYLFSHKSMQPKRKTIILDY